MGNTTAIERSTKNEVNINRKIQIGRGSRQNSRKLLVLDLNGILMQRISSTQVNINPLSNQFFEQISKYSNIDYAIWTTSLKEVLEKDWKDFISLVDIRNKEPIFLWNENNCKIDGLSREILGEPLFLKSSKTIFNQFPHNQYNNKNTLIVEHSTEKVTRNGPNNSIILYEYSITSHESFNPLIILSQLLQHISSSIDIRTLDCLNCWRVQKYTKIPSIGIQKMLGISLNYLMNIIILILTFIIVINFRLLFRFIIHSFSEMIQFNSNFDRL
jgi:hypothetical protein